MVIPTKLKSVKKTLFYFDFLMVLLHFIVSLFHHFLIASILRHLLYIHLSLCDRLNDSSAKQIPEFIDEQSSQFQLK